MTMTDTNKGIDGYKQVRGMVNMDKTTALCQLHGIIDHYLLGSGRWPADREGLSAILKKVRELGLDEEVVPDSLPHTTRSTRLGKELQLDLLLAFVGAWEMWEIPSILEDNGYLDRFEAEELYSDPPATAERKLHGYVLRAYFAYCRRTALLH